MFKLGDTVVFNRDYYPKYLKSGYKYPPFIGVNGKPDPLFTFICEQNPQTGHCILINNSTKQIEVMCHINEFRLATEEEC